MQIRLTRRSAGAAGPAHSVVRAERAVAQGGRVARLHRGEHHRPTHHGVHAHPDGVDGLQLTTGLQPAAHTGHRHRRQHHGRCGRGAVAARGLQLHRHQRHDDAHAHHDHRRHRRRTSPYLVRAASLALTGSGSARTHLGIYRRPYCCGVDWGGGAGWWRGALVVARLLELLLPSLPSLAWMIIEHRHDISSRDLVLFNQTLAL
jgi:hypothetical protein